MQTTLQSAMLKPGRLAVLAEWWPVMIGLLVLYVPMYVTLANGIWDSEEGAHGPIVLAVVLGFFWLKRQAFLEPAHNSKPFAGGALFGLGLLLYVIGRSQEILMLQTGSQIPLLVGLLLMLRGTAAVRTLWFPLLFILFMIPLPSFVVDALTGPLKEHVSALVEEVMYYVGYPIARRGVMLSIGPYQLLVADACSGLNSMFSLSAMGLLYMYVMRHTSWLRNGLLLAAIWPIAFAANTLRVIILVLVTYYLGNEAGQGFLHGVSGIALFITGLLMLIALDGALGLVLKDKKHMGGLA